jgi:GNAT superfamily N-acetyltransferase
VSTLPPDYELTGDPERINAAAAHAYLVRSYWAQDIPLEIVRRAIGNSICVVAFTNGQQVGMARVVSDRATFAYLADVYVLEEHRGRGLSHAMLNWLDRHADLQGLRRWALFTQDAQGLYEAHGWSVYPHPERMMTRDDPEIYA